MKHTSINDLLSDGPPSDNGDDSDVLPEDLSDSALIELIEQLEDEDDSDMEPPFQTIMDPFTVRMIDVDSLLELIEWPFNLGYTLEDFMEEAVAGYSNKTDAFEFAAVDHNTVNEAFDYARTYHEDLEACWSRFNKWSNENRNVYINMR